MLEYTLEAYKKLEKMQKAHGKYLLCVTSKCAQNLTRRPIKEHYICINTPSCKNVLWIHDKNQVNKWNNESKFCVSFLAQYLKYTKMPIKLNCISTQVIMITETSEHLRVLSIFWEGLSIKIQVYALIFLTMEIPHSGPKFT